MKPIGTTVKLNVNGIFFGNPKRYDDIGLIRNSNGD